MEVHRRTSRWTEEHEDALEDLWGTEYGKLFWLEAIVSETNRTRWKPESHGLNWCLVSSWRRKGEEAGLSFNDDV